MTHIRSMRRDLSSSLVFLVSLSLALALIAGAGTSGSAATPVAQVRPPSKLVQPGTLTLGTDFTYPPYEYIENGQKKGFDVDLATRVAALMGLKLNMVDTRFASLIPGLEAGKFDAIQTSMYITAARTKVVSFIPYETTANALVVKSGSFQPKLPSQLCGHSLAVLTGSVQAVMAATFQKDCHGKLTVQSFPTDTGAFEQLVAGRTDVYLTDLIVARYRVKAVKGVDIANAGQPPLYPAPLGIAYPKHGSSDVARAYEQAFAILEKNGELPRLLKQYGILPVNPKLVKQALAGTLPGY